MSLYGVCKVKYDFRELEKCHLLVIDIHWQHSETEYALFVDLVKCLTNFDEMLAVVCLDGEGEVIFVTVSTFVLQILYGIWKEGGL